MSTSWLVLLLSCGIVLQLTAAFPQQSVSQDSDSTDSLNSARNEVLDSTLEILTSHSANVLQNMKYFMTNFVKELKTLPNRSRKINKFIKRFEKSIKHIGNINFDEQEAEVEKIYAAVDEFQAIFADIEALPKGKDIKTLENALGNIDKESVEEKLSNNDDQTITKLRDTFERFEQTLSDDEKEEEHELIDWIKRFNEEDNYEEKLGPLIDEFISFFE